MVLELHHCAAPHPHGVTDPSRSHDKEYEAHAMCFLKKSPTLPRLNPSLVMSLYAAASVQEIQEIGTC